MDLTVKQLKEMLEGGFISHNTYMDALMELNGCKDKLDWFADYAKGSDTSDDNPAWFDSFKKFKKSHPVYGGGEHEVPYEAGYAEGVKQTAEMYRPSIDRAIELELRVEEMAMSYDKHTADIRYRIKKATDALENGDSKKAEIILLRLLKDH